MQVSAERIDKKTVEITVEVPNENLQKGLKKAFADISKKVNIPGFRKGKVPRQILVKTYGIEMFLEEAANNILPEEYEAMLEKVEPELMPIGKPSIDLVQLEEKKPFIFKVKADVKPEFEMAEYKNIELTKEEVEVTDEEVDAEIAKLQEKHSTLDEVAEGAKIENGNTILLDFKGMIEGVPFEGGSAEDYKLEVGSGSFIPGFEEQLVGMGLNEEGVVDVKFPDEYHSEDLKGKDAKFEVKIKEIRAKNLPELNDEFADSISEFETLADLKADLKAKLLEAKERTADANLKRDAVDKAAENFEIEIPEAMVDIQIDGFLQNMEINLSRQGLNLEQYLKYTDDTIENLRKKYRDDAVKAVKKNLVLEAIAKAESIEVAEDELNEELNKIAEMYKKEIEEVREILEQNGEFENMKNSIKMDKAVDAIIEAANFAK